MAAHVPTKSCACAIRLNLLVGIAVSLRDVGRDPLRLVLAE